MNSNTNDWPELAPMSAVRRLTVLTSALEGAAIERRVLDVDRDQLWRFIERLDESVPTFDPLVRALSVAERDDAGRITRVISFPGRLTFDVKWGDGWCLMQSKWYIVGMAAESLPDGRTLYAHMECIRPPRSARVRAICRPVLRSLTRIHRRTVRSDIDGIEEQIAAW